MAPRYEFKSYSLKTVAFSRPEFAPEDNGPHEVSIHIDVYVERNAEHRELFRVKLVLHAEGGVQADIELFGVFSVVGDPSTDWNKELQVVGGTVLLPFARSILAGLSSQDGSEPFIVPLIDLNEAFRGEQTGK